MRTVFIKDPAWLTAGSGVGGSGSGHVTAPPLPCSVCPPLGVLESRLGIRGEAGLGVVIATQAPLGILGVSKELGPTLYQGGKFPLAVWLPVLEADLGS